MRFSKIGVIILCSLFISCKSDIETYFPLGEKRMWSYRVDIIPEIEKKIIFKKISSGLEKQKIQLLENEEDIYAYPIQRENQSIYFYSYSKKGIKRLGYQEASGDKFIFDKKDRFVIKYPLEKGNSWNSISKTYLTLRRYPYFDYKAITDFNILHEIVSTSDVVQVPAGKFKNCLKINGFGETSFLADREIGSINIRINTTDWFAPNIGLIKSVRIEQTDTDLFGTTKMVKVLDKFNY